jgi:UDP-N-acetylmuramyl pentapeptide phosphotransferase/UDP-N-acetylglucosamine-1-phosphate transferase
MEVKDFFQPLVSSLIRYFIILLASYGLTAFVFPYIRGLISEANLTKPNFRDEMIPAVAGLIFVVMLPLICGIGLILSVKSFTSINVFLFLFVIIGMGLLGFLDDQLGNHNDKGFRGHFTALLKEKRLTTGGFKAAFGAVIALVFCIGTAKLIKTSWAPWQILINFLLVSLAANSINLFDLRPGRAGKIYIIGFILIFAFSKRFDDYIGLFFPILAIMMYYLPYDLRARVMMGDVGSNLLGASLGVMMAWMFSDVSKIVALIIMVALQIAAEKFSFTEIIEKYSLLRHFDQLGRRKY